MIFLNDGGIDHNYSLINKNQDRPLAQFIVIKLEWVQNI